MSSGLTEQEQYIAQLISQAWIEFDNLEAMHPSEKREFTDGVHSLQKLLAMRVVRRDYPDYWINKGGE